MFINDFMKKIVVFSGAGMSAESGIQTFRGNNGLWENYAVESVATPDAWNKDPDLVTRFYNERRKQIIESKPNKAHDLVFQLEQYYNVVVVTQNIDDLHERAGSTNVLHLHGNIRLAKSSGPKQENAYYPIDGWELSASDTCPDGYRLRPHVVWFGEDVPMFAEAIDTVQTADIFVVIGTSLLVYPAADLVHYVPYGCEAYLIDPNAEISGVPKNFQFINHTAVQGMQLLFEKLTSLVDP
jgi:NAD-dependent deacetylase